MKTPEQASADDALEEAVRRVVAAYQLVPPNSLITDYMVIGEATSVSSDDESCDIFIAFRNGHSRLTTSLGIMELGRRHLMAHWSGEEER